MEDLYRRYNEEIKPLVAEIEGRLEKFAAPLLLDMADMFDNIAMSELSDEDDRISFLSLAKTHGVELSIYHSYQYLVYALYTQRIRPFKMRCKRHVLMKLNNGMFYGEFMGLYKETRKLRKTVNLKKDCPEDIMTLKTMYNNLRHMEDMIIEAEREIIHHERFTESNWIISLKWMASIAISVLVGFLFTKYLSA